MWIISISLASVQLFVAKVVEVEYRRKKNDITDMDNQTFFLLNTSFNDAKKTNSNIQNIIVFQCNEFWTHETPRRIYTVFNFFAVYLLPVFILAYTYSCIACIIKKTTHPGNADASRDMQSNKSKRKVS